MTRIIELLAGTRNVKPHKSTSMCEFQIVASDGKAPLVQFSTFGSEDRATGGVSQTIQLDLDMAIQFHDVLSKFIAESRT